MEKLKKVFSPGSSKDDEIMYANPEARRKESLTSTSEQESAKSQTVEGSAAPKETAGALSQTSNPGGHRYDDQKLGETATTGSTERDQGKSAIGAKLYPEHGVIEESRTDKPGIDSIGYTETVKVHDSNTKQEDSDGKKGQSILGKIFHPSGKKNDEDANESDAHTSGDKDASQTHKSGRTDKTGAAAGTTATLADRSIVPESNEPGISDSTAGYSGADAGATSGYGGAGIAGLAVADTAGAGASTAPKYNEPQDDVLGRSHPLRDGSGSGTAHINPVGAPEASISEYTAQTQSIAHPGAGTATAWDASGGTNSFINPIGAPSTARTTNSTAPSATSAALLGTGAAATGGLAASSNARNDTTSETRAYEAHSSNQSKNQSDVIGCGTSTGGAPKISESSQQGDFAGAADADHSGTRSSSGETHHPPGAKLDCDGNPERGYVHHVSGPHSTDAANQLDPALPGA